MKTLTREETVEKVYGYEASDGTFFKSEDECRKYEEGARCAASLAAKSLEFSKTTGGSFHDNVFCFGYEDDVVVYDIKTANDLQIVNTYIELINQYGTKRVIPPEHIGKKVCVSFWDGDSAYISGTRSEMRACFEAYLNTLFGEEIKTENESGEDDACWFGRVRWCKEDVISVLSQLGVELSEENIDKAYNSLKADRGLQACMVEAGWEYLKCAIEDLF